MIALLSDTEEDTIKEESSSSKPFASAMVEIEGTEAVDTADDRPEEGDTETCHKTSGAGHDGGYQMPSLPEDQKVEMPKIEIPELPKIDLPDIGFTFQDFSAVVVSEQIRPL